MHLTSMVSVAIFLQFPSSFVFIKANYKLIIFNADFPNELTHMISTTKLVLNPILYLIPFILYFLTLRDVPVL